MSGSARARLMGELRIGCGTGKAARDWPCFDEAQALELRLADLPDRNGESP